MEGLHVIPGEEDEEKVPFEPVKFRSAGDLSMRLCQSFIRYKGEPVYVLDSVHSSKIVDCMYLKDGGKAVAFGVDVDDDDVDISSPPLGYINYNGNWHLSRLSERRQKQGLDIRRALARNAFQGKVNAHNVLGGGVTSWLDLRKTILGEYPTFEKALEYGTPFARRFSIDIAEDNTRILSYMGNSIGLIRKNKSSILLREGYNSPAFRNVMKDAGVPL